MPADPHPAPEPAPTAPEPGADPARPTTGDATSLTTSSPTPPAAAAGDSAVGDRPQIVLCPYCGQTQTRSHKCNACGGLFEPLSRRATQIAMGPWYLRDKHQPFRPGFSYPILKQMIQSGRVTPTTVLRGPTTRQFWSIARNVPGVAHLLGYCHQCHRHVETDPSPDNCPHCEARFKSVRQRNELGLQFPTRRAAESAQRALNRILGLAPTSGDDADKSGRRSSSRDAEGKRRKSRSSSRSQTQESPDLSEAHTDADHQELAAAAAAARDAGMASTAAANVFETAPDPAAPAPPDLSSDLVDEMLAELPPAAALVAQRKKKAERAEKAARQQARESDAAPTRGSASAAEPTAALPPRSPINATVWLLIVLNVLVAAGVIAYILLGRG